jgi:type VI protein secretion system component Hcp
MRGRKKAVPEVTPAPKQDQREVNIRALQAAKMIGQLRLERDLVTKRMELQVKISNFLLASLRRHAGTNTKHINDQLEQFKLEYEMIDQEFQQRKVDNDLEFEIIKEDQLQFVR